MEIKSKRIYYGILYSNKYLLILENNDIPPDNLLHECINNMIFVGPFECYNIEEGRKKIENNLKLRE